MTDSKHETFEDSLSQEEKSLYSVNFLLARFTPAGDGRGNELLRNKLASGHYQSRDFAVVRFYKNTSTPLSRFVPIEGEDE